jgi:predicted nucleotidyltransferase
MMRGIHSCPIKAMSRKKGSSLEVAWRCRMASPSRLALAKAIAADLRKREGRNLVAVGVYGSVARREERQHSDIDMLVVVRQKRVRIRHSLRSGVLATILQETPEEARNEVRGAYPGLNDALGGWRSLRPICDPSGLLRRLRDEAKGPSVVAFRKSAQIHFFETFEDLGKLWNAIAAHDAEESREMAIWFSGAAMGTLFDLEGRVLMTGRQAFVELRRYGRIGAAIRRLRYASPSLPEMQRLSEFIWKRLLDRAKAKGLRLPPFPRDARGTL